jgi:L,D-transpeptidase catalytic domain
MLVPPVPPVPPAPPTAPVAASAKLALERVHKGKPAFAVVGEQVRIAGSVTPYVAGQRLLVAVYRNGRKVLTRRVPILPSRSGAGRFQLLYGSPRSGTVRVQATHAASAAMAGFTTNTASVRFYSPELSVGARGPTVWALQRELALLRYAVPLNGYFDEATARAVIAYRKMTGLPRIESTGARVFKMLQRRAGSYRVRFHRDGAHVEADLNRQVLVEVEPHGRVHRIYTMSSGKPSTPTPLGSFTVYEKALGTNSEGMVDSNFFIRGYAIHGYAEVPVFAASHGCLRIPIPDAPAVFAWVRVEAQQAGEVAQAEAVDQQREQRVDDVLRPGAAQTAREAGEGRGDSREGFVDRFAQAALLTRGSGRLAVRRVRAALAGGRLLRAGAVQLRLLMRRGLFALFDREAHEPTDGDQADRGRGDAHYAGDQRSDHRA